MGAPTLHGYETASLLLLAVVCVAGVSCFPELGEYTSVAAGGGATSSTGGAGGAGAGDVCPTAPGPTSTIVIGNGGITSLLAMAVEPVTGSVAVAGTFTGDLVLGNETLTAAPPSVGVFLAQYDPDQMTPRWSKRLVLYDPATPSGYGLANVSLAFGPAGLVAAGSFTGEIEWEAPPIAAMNYADAFAVTLDPDGSVVWGHTYGDPNSALVNAMAVGGGEVVLTGLFNVALNFYPPCPTLTTPGSGDVDLFVAKVRADDGTCVVASKFGDGEAQHGTGVALVGTDVIVSGDFRGQLSFGTTATLNAVGASGPADLFVAKLDESLQGLVAVGVGTQDVDGYGRIGVVPTSDGSFLYGGALVPPLVVPPLTEQYGGLDWVIGRVATSGMGIAGNVFGSSEIDTGFMAARPDGSSYRGYGSFAAEGHFGALAPRTATGRDGFIVELASDLTPLCVEQFGGPGDQVVGAIGYGGGDEVLAGNFKDAILLGGEERGSVGGVDIFVHRRLMPPVPAP